MGDAAASQAGGFGARAYALEVDHRVSPRSGPRSRVRWSSSASTKRSTPAAERPASFRIGRGEQGRRGGAGPPWRGGRRTPERVRRTGRSAGHERLTPSSLHSGTVREHPAEHSAGTLTPVQPLSDAASPRLIVSIASSRSSGHE